MKTERQKMVPGAWYGCRDDRIGALRIHDGDWSDYIASRVLPGPGLNVRMRWIHSV